MRGGVLAVVVLLFAAPRAVDAQSMPFTPRTMEAYRLGADVAIDLDGRLDEAVWQVAPSYADFVQKEPVEGTPAINDTRVWLLYDESSLYVGAINYDEDPSSIARNMARRDAAYAGRSDYFEVMFDPNGDGLTGYRFRVTAGGVQIDRYLYEDDKEDAAWDAVYESLVTVDERGWIVEMRIPLSQLRYETSDDPQTWGVQFGRRRAADNELTRFSFVSLLRPGRVSQFGRAEGLVLDRSARRIEMLPYALSQGHRGTARPGDPFFDGSDVGGRVGVDVSYGVGTAFMLDATVNPDFGQVEADPAVVNLTAFETFFPERRPFFVEDARIFDFNLGGGSNSLFYSRRVGRPPHGGDSDGADFTREPDATSILAAAKVTGRTTGGLSVGALLASTREERADAFFAPTGRFDQYVVEPRSTWGVVRIQQDVRGGQSRFGGIVTGMNRDQGTADAFSDLPASAFSTGLDFEHSWADRAWALWGFLAGSHVRGDSLAMQAVQTASNHYLQRPDLEWGAFDPPATSMTGIDWRLQLERRSGRWTGAVWAAEITNGFENNDLGFNTAPERLDGGFRVAYQTVQPGRYFRKSSVTFSTFHNFSHEALRDTWSLDRWGSSHTAGTVSLSSKLEFLSFWTADLGVTYGPDVMSRRLTRGGPRMEEPGSVGLSAAVGTDNRKLLFVRPRITLERGRRGTGNDATFEMSATLQPSTQLLITLTPSYRRSSTGSQYVARSTSLSYAPTYGARYLFADLERRDLSMIGRVNWTFTPRLSLELFTQPLVSSGDYLTYKQLRMPESFDFDSFEEGTPNGVGCAGGRTCQDVSGERRIDFDDDGVVDLRFADRDFNLRSLRATAVLRWEYRPGSTVFLVWQRQQAERAARGDFDLSRDLDALLHAPTDDVFMVKANVWLSW